VQPVWEADDAVFVSRTILGLVMCEVFECKAVENTNAHEVGPRGGDEIQTVAPTEG
jgi:hypothetical protein